VSDCLSIADCVTSLYGYPPDDGTVCRKTRKQCSRTVRMDMAFDCMCRFFIVIIIIIILLLLFLLIIIFIYYYPYFYFY